jgi:hypothetical protein
LIKLVLTRGVNERHYQELDTISRQASIALADLYRPFGKKLKTDIDCLPNLHAGDHAATNARATGVMGNSSTSVGEMKHRIWKQKVPHTNHRETDLVYINLDNVQQSTRAALQGRCSQRTAQLFQELSRRVPALFQAARFCFETEDNGRKRKNMNNITLGDIAGRRVTFQLLYGLKY